MMKKSTQTYLLPILFFSLSIFSGVSAVCNLELSENLTHKNLNIDGAQALSPIGRAIYAAAIVAACTNGTAFEFEFAGQDYQCVTNTGTKKVWLDRLLGASRVCTARTDTQCYGDFYQWGRNTDGHEKINSATNPSAIPYATTDNANFIKGNSEWASDDFAGLGRQRRWAATDSSSICPIGFRVPTITELVAERDSWEENNRNINRDSAFASALKWPTAGRRVINGSIQGVGGNGNIWSNSIDGISAPYLFFGSSNAAIETEPNRAKGQSVRCLQTDAVADAIADACHENEAFEFADNTYRCVTNIRTQKVWLDRNLGASKVCENQNEAACYGDLYQWGRNKDGHQRHNSEIITSRIKYTQTDSADYILFVGDWAKDDFDGSRREKRWATPDGGGVCPIGFRVPTMTELSNEGNSWNGNNIDGFASELKLPTAGLRDFIRNNGRNFTHSGYLWSTNPVADNRAQHLFFLGNRNGGIDNIRRDGTSSIRCIQD